MDKKVKTSTKNGNPLVILNKFSLSMTIINFSILGLALLGVIIGLIGTWTDAPDILSTIGEYILIGSIGIGVLSSFLAIGQFVLNKKVTKISNRITPKISNIVFGVFFALFLLAGIAFAVAIAVQNSEFKPSVLPTDIMLGVSAGLFGISLIGQAIMSTIVMVKTKEK